VSGSLARREVPVLVLSALSVPLVLLDGRISRLEGAGLLAAALVYSVWMVRSARRGALAAAEQAAAQLSEAADLAGAPSPAGRLKQVLTAVAGLAGLVLGGSLFVDGASGLARDWGMSERLIGLTIVAVGTSLPELATSVIAAWRGHSDIAVGNVVGSNIFNALLCLGGASAVAPIEVPLASVQLDLVVMGALTLAGAAALRSERLVTRPEGGFFLAAYVGYLAWLIFG
jgi:cation:H+ antiporter